MIIYNLRVLWLFLDKFKDYPLTHENKQNLLIFSMKFLILGAISAKHWLHS